MKRAKQPTRKERSAASVIGAGLGAYATRLGLDANEVGCFRAIEDHVRMYASASPGCIFVLADTDPATFHVNVIIPGAPIETRVWMVLALLTAADDGLAQAAEQIAEALEAPLGDGFCRAVVLSRRRLLVQDLRYVPTTAPGGQA